MTLKNLIISAGLIGLLGLTGCKGKPDTSVTPPPIDKGVPTTINNPSQNISRDTLCQVVVDAVDVKKKKKKVSVKGLNGFKTRKTKRSKQNTIEGNILSVYFGTNSWALQRNDINDIAGYVNRLAKKSSIIVEGYADFRGTEEWNQELGNNRAEGVAKVLTRNLNLKIMASVC